MKFSNRLIAILSAGIVIFSSFNSKPAGPDFSGKWKLNESKSDLGQFANFANRVVEVVQTAESISISRTANSFDGGETVSKEQLPFSGAETESTLMGTSKKKSTASWAADGKQFIITYVLQLDFNGQSNEIKGKETWSLSDDGKVLTIKNNSSSSFGDLATTSVYEK